MFTSGNQRQAHLNTISKGLMFWGAVAAGTGVVLGAFGAHSLKGTLAPEMLVTFETAVRYEMYHAFALIATGLACALYSPETSREFKLAGFLFGTGILLFSGSLYFLVLTDVLWLGIITPLGGISFISGWVVLAIAFWKER